MPTGAYQAETENSGILQGRISSLWHQVKSNPAASFFWASLMLGIILRLYVFAGGRMLWLDESMIALNLMTRSGDELREPLNFLQMAPIGWLYANKFMYELTGSVNFGFRITSLITGLGALGLFAWFCQRLFSMPIAACMTLAFAVSGLLVRYSVELKPYGSDAFFTLAVLGLAWLITEDRHGRSKLYIGLLALTGLVGVVSSFPIVYVLGGCGGTAILYLFFNGRRLDAGLLAFAAIIWLIVFAMIMQSVYLTQATGTGFREEGINSFFSMTGYAPFPPMSASDLIWYPRWVHNMAKFLFGEFATYPALVLMLAGVWLMAIARRWLLAMILVTFFLALIGSMLESYPLFERLLLFALPLLLLLIGQALETLRTELSRRARAPVIAGTLVIIIIGSMFPLADGMRQKPAFARQDLGPLFEHIRNEFQPGDILALNVWAVPTYLIYRDDFGLGDTNWTILPKGENADGATLPGMEVRETCLASIVADMTPGARVWGLRVRPLSKPSSPVQMPDYADTLDRDSLPIKTHFAKAQIRLDTFRVPEPGPQEITPDAAICAYEYDITRELQRARPPLIPGN